MARDLALEKKKTSAYPRAHGLEKNTVIWRNLNWLDARGTLRQKEQPIWLLFDYEVRDPLTNEAAITEISEDVFI